MSQVNSLKDLFQGIILQGDRKIFYDNYTAEHERFRSENQAYATENADLKGKIKTQADEYAEKLKTLVDGHTKEVKDLNEAHTTKVGELEQEINEYKTEAQTQSGRKASYRRLALAASLVALVAVGGAIYSSLQHASSEGEVAKLTAENKILQADSDKSGKSWLTTQNEELLSEKGKWTEDNSELKEKVANLTKENDDLKSVKPDDQIVALKGQVADLTNKLGLSQATVDSFRGQLKTAQDNLKAAQDELNSTKTDLKSAQDENDSLKSKQATSPNPSADGKPSLNPEADQPVTPQPSNNDGQSMTDSSPGATADQSGTIQSQPAPDDTQVQSDSETQVVASAPRLMRSSNGTLIPENAHLKHFRMNDKQPWVYYWVGVTDKDGQDRPLTLEQTHNKVYPKPGEHIPAICIGLPPVGFKKGHWDTAQTRFVYDEVWTAKDGFVEITPQVTSADRQ